MMQDWLAQRAARSPERVALIFGGRQWTFRELDVRVTELAQRLTAMGIGKNDRVAVLMRNSDLYVALVHALARTGAVLVPLNTRLTPEELKWQLERVQARVLFYDDAWAEVASQQEAGSGKEEAGGRRQEAVSSRELAGGWRKGAGDGGQGKGDGEVAGGRRQEAEGEREGTEVGKRLSVSGNQWAVSGEQPSIASWDFRFDDAHSILFTSGTTGKPKGAVLTYGNHCWNAMGSALNLGLHEDDVWLACMPLFHIGGLAILLRGVIYGIPVVLHESFDAEAVNRALDEQRVTIVSLVSTMLQRLIDARGDAAFPSSLRCVLLGGGPAPRELLERCARLNVPVVQTYGLTEAASQVATLAPQDALRKLGSAGKPLMGLELKIEGAKEEEGGKKVGEIVIRGPTVLREYADEPEATARALRDGWFHTGDLGYLDEEGFLYVVARREDLIVSGGENIYPAEIEGVLKAHPAIQDAAVVGVEDARWVQVPVAFVILRAGENVGVEKLKSYCAGRLARYKIPAEIVFVEEFPRNAAGKLLRRGLVNR